jgi:P27 family predicted phage terminase small subunit
MRWKICKDYASPATPARRLQRAAYGGRGGKIAKPSPKEDRWGNLLCAPAKLKLKSTFWREPRNIMTRGRKPKLTHLKVVQGNPGKRKINTTDPKPRKSKKIAPPTHLCEIARKEWKRVIDELVTIGTLTILDMATLEGYCSSYADTIEAQRIIDEEGRFYESVTKDGGTIKRKHPAVAMYNESLKIMRSFASELGMTPVSRSRVTASKEQQEDPMEAFLNRGKKKD